MGHTQNSVDMQSINLRVNSIFALFLVCLKKDLSSIEDKPLAIRKMQEGFHETMAAVSTKVVPKVKM